MAETPPYIYKSSSGTLIGSEMDVIRVITDKMGAASMDLRIEGNYGEIMDAVRTLMNPFNTYPYS